MSTFVQSNNGIHVELGQSFERHSVLGTRLWSEIWFEVCIIISVYVFFQIISPCHDTILHIGLFGFPGIGMSGGLFSFFILNFYSNFVLKTNIHIYKPTRCLFEATSQTWKAFNPITLFKIYKHSNINISIIFVKRMFFGVGLSVEKF